MCISTSVREMQVHCLNHCSLIYLSDLQSCSEQQNYSLRPEAVLTLTFAYTEMHTICGVQQKQTYIANDSELDLHHARIYS